jgi:hypothetical protein
MLTKRCFTQEQARTLIIALCYGVDDGRKPDFYVANWHRVPETLHCGFIDGDIESYTAEAHKPTPDFSGWTGDLLTDMYSRGHPELLAAAWTYLTGGVARVDDDQVIVLASDFDRMLPTILNGAKIVHDELMKE